MNELRLLFMAENHGMYAVWLEKNKSGYSVNVYTPCRYYAAYDFNNNKFTEAKEFFNHCCKQLKEKYA